MMRISLKQFFLATVISSVVVLSAGHSMARSPDMVAPETTIADLAKAYIRENPSAALEAMIESMTEWSRDMSEKMRHKGRGQGSEFRAAGKRFLKQIDERVAALQGHIIDLESHLSELTRDAGHDHHEKHYQELLDQIDLRIDPLYDRIANLEDRLGDLRFLIEEMRDHHEKHHDHHSHHLEDQDDFVTDFTADGGEGEGWFNPAEEILEFSQHPVYGQDDARFSLVYFYNYDCEACRVGDEMLRRVVDDNPEFRIVYRDLSTPDNIEGRLSMATWQVDPRNFHSVHTLFMGEEEIPSPEETMGLLSEKLGTESAELVWQMAFPEEGEEDTIAPVLEANRHLAEAIDFDLIPRIHLNSALSFYEMLPEEDDLRKDIERFLAENA